MLFVGSRVSNPTDQTSGFLISIPLFGNSDSKYYGGRISAILVIIDKCSLKLNIKKSMC
jgi:hypothetical protein